MKRTTTTPPDTIPDQINNPGLNDYLEVMSRAVFQAGLSWASIAKNWNAYRAAFDGFNVRHVALYGDAEVERLMQTPNLLHSARKIRATIENARTLIALDEKHGRFRTYLQSFGDYTSLAKAFRRDFMFMGEMNVWYFLFRVGEPVPQFEHWVRTIQGDHPRMQEMVRKGRSAGTSTEY